MLQSVEYSSGNQSLSVSVARREVLLKSDEILNFPRIIELEGDRLVLPYGSGRHGGVETRPVATSHDFGRSWVDVPPDNPFTDNLQTSGILGYLREGTIAYIDVFPLNAEWSREEGPYHDVAKVEDPTFRIRRFSKQAELFEDSTFKIRNLPWETGSYEFYGTLLEMENGDYLTAFQVQVKFPTEMRCDFTTFVGRSTDGGRTFEPVRVFHPEIDGEPVGDQGFCEPDMVILANGDILCMMRTGSRSPMYQSRSTDGGSTWTTPESIGWPGVKPDLQLLTNGVLACSSGRGVYGHHQITYAMFSLDGTGRT